VSGSAVSVSATAADNVGVVGLQFKLDGVNLGAEDTASPYTNTWNTTTASNGSHTLTAVARDAAGNTATATIVTVTVNNSATDTTAPTDSMTAPANGATVSSTAVMVSANAADNVGVVGVQFKLDGANLGTESMTSPYSRMWDTTAGSNGSHTLTAVARDAAGNTATAAMVTVTVNNTDVTPPTASMTAPANGATVSGTAVTVSATASDNIGVTGVQFQLDGVNLGANDTTSPYTISWNTTTATAGSHSLTAVARDAAGNSLTSSAITVTVANDVTPPVISGVAATSVTTTSATIVWTTNESSDSQVDYGLTTSYGSSSTLNSTLVTSHSVPLSGLSASTTYHARARSRDAAGNLSISGDVTFATGAITPPPSGWPHEPAGFAAFASTSLDSFGGNGWNIVNSSGLATIVADAGGSLTPPNVGQWKYPSGFGGGTAPATMYHALPNSFNEGFVGTMWKASNPWQGHSTFVNKIFFLLGGACGNLIPIMYGPNGGPYQLRVAPEWGNWSWLTPNVNDVPIALGSWHRIELYFKYNTSGSGIVRWWMDGTLIGNYTNITFPSSGCFAEFQYSPTWGGVGDVKNETDFFWFDDPYISIPSGSAPPPPPPPPPPPCPPPPEKLSPPPGRADATLANARIPRTMGIARFTCGAPYRYRSRRAAR
jgi:predicted secreted protein